LRKALTLALAALVAALVAGCDNKPALQAMPEVNDENCKPENIQKIEEKAHATRIRCACARRGTFKPSEPKKW
jgi:entry exclusion lipoprotein TrbK